MTNVKRFRGIPPARRQETAESFIAAAPRKQVLPWHLPTPADARTAVNMAQPLQLMRQVDWLAHETGRTKRDVMEQAIREYLQRELTRLGVDPAIPD